MRTLIDIPENQLKELNAISQARKIPRAELVRQAISSFLHLNRPGPEKAFGIWRDQALILPGPSEPLPKDGLEYQQRVRSEW
jgi:hypothetical protein